MKKMISSKKGLTTEFIVILFVVITVIIIISIIAALSAKGSDMGGGFIGFLKGVFGGS